MAHFYLDGKSDMDVWNEIENDVHFGASPTYVTVGPGLSDEFVVQLLRRRDLTLMTKLATEREHDRDRLQAQLSFV